MIEAQPFIDELVKRQRTFVAGTPCSYLQPFINRVIDDANLIYSDAANEGDAVAMVAGAFVGGQPGAVLFQNAGLGNAVNALTSLCYPFRIPVLLLIAHRGQPDGLPDEPQHELMGQITADMLGLMGIPWEPFPRAEEEVAAALDRAQDSMARSLRPFAFVLSKDSVAEYSLQKTHFREPRAWGLLPAASARKPLDDLPFRQEVLSCYLRLKRPEDVVVCTTGFTGRELYALKDAPNHLYLVGSMGSAASFSLGLALVRPRRRLVVFDGDGAVLMRMGNLALVGANKPANFVHIILDNACYESTGKQSTLSPAVCLTAIAQACGYAHACLAESIEDFDRILTSLSTGPALVHVRIRTGSPSNLGRPRLKPFEVKDRLMKELEKEPR